MLRSLLRHDAACGTDGGGPSSQIEAGEGEGHLSYAEFFFEWLGVKHVLMEHDQAGDEGFALSIDEGGPFRNFYRALVADGFDAVTFDEDALIGFWDGPCAVDETDMGDDYGSAFYLHKWT